jgi:hypothetical protein
MLRSGEQALPIGHAVAMTGLGLGGSRPQAAATGCYRAARSGPRDRAACRRLGPFGSRPLPQGPRSRNDTRNRGQGRPRTRGRSVRSTAVSDFSPDRSKPAAVLGTVKAEPCGWPPRRPALTAPARGCLGRPRVGAEKRASGRTEKLGQVKGDEASTRSLGSIARLVLFVSFSTAPPQGRRGVW